MVCTRRSLTTKIHTLFPPKNERDHKDNQDMGRLKSEIQTEIYRIVDKEMLQNIYNCLINAEIDLTTMKKIVFVKDAIVGALINQYGNNEQRDMEIKQVLKPNGKLQTALKKIKDINNLNAKRELKQNR